MDSGIIYAPYDGGSRFYMAWQVGTQDVANNRTLIHWQAGIQITGGWWWGANSLKINSIHIDGGGSLGSGTWGNISGAGNHQLQSGSKWVTHNADGTKSFSANMSVWYTGTGNRSASGSWSLPTIPRNSQVSTNKTSYTLGEPIQIITNRKSSSFSHTITIRQSNSGGTVIKTINSVGDSTTWTPTSGEIETMQNMIPNSNKLTLYINQYNNQVKANSAVSRVLTLTEANPIYTEFTFKDSDATTVGITGNNQVLVKGKSTLQVDISSANKMTAIKGASEDRYSIAYDGMSEIESYSDDSTVTASFNNVLTIGNRTIEVTAYDSRNNATKVSKDVTVYDYAEPTILTTLTRENNFGSDTTIKIEGTYTPLVIGGSAKNAPKTGSLEYRYKEEFGEFGSWVTKTFTDNDDGTYEVADFVVSLDNTKKYLFEFHIDDEFGTVTTTAVVDVGKPIMFVGQNGGEAAVSIGSMPVDGAPLTINGSAVHGCPYDVGDIYITVNPDRNTPEKVAARWPGTTWVAWAVGRGPMGVDDTQLEFNEVEKTGGEKTHTLTTNEMPAHNHGIAARWSASGGTTNESGLEYANTASSGGGTFNSGNRGGGQAHNNLQPYITCYMWKRIS